MAAGAGFAIGGIKGAVIGALARVGLAALMPDAVGTPHELEGKGKNPIALHGMDQVIDSIERQKTEDQKIIASATGKHCPSNAKEYGPEDFISEHAYKRHAYDPKANSTSKQTRYAENVDPTEIRKETLRHPDRVEKIFDKNTGEHYATRYTKDMKYNISQPPAKSTISKVILNVVSPSRSTQFPYAQRDK